MSDGCPLIIHIKELDYTIFVLDSEFSLRREYFGVSFGLSHKRNMDMDKPKQSIKELVLPPGDHPEFDGSSYPGLISLDCSARNCEVLDLLDNRLLESLNCSINSLGSLDLGECENLVSVDCSFNVLEELILPVASDIEVLDCSHNMLKSLDLRGTGNLRELYCDANENLTSLELPSREGRPLELEFLDISYTALSSEWLRKVEHFPIPAEGCEDQLFIFNSCLARDDGAVEYLCSLGWQPVVEEE